MNRLEIRLSGFGGQGIVRSGEIVGKAAALYDGRHATFTQSYGPESRGGACAAQVIIADDPVELSYPHLVDPSILIIMSQGAYNKYVPGFRKDGLLIIDEDLAETGEAAEGLRILSIPATRLAEELGLPLILVQHHHAHIASVLAENGWPLQGGKVLGIALDGSGYGDDGTVWGGEFMIADYLGYQRVGMLTPMPLPGGTQAILQPWRNSFSQLQRALGWTRVAADWGELEAVRWLAAQPVESLTQMIATGLNSPLTSSCGRLFDAVATALGICSEGISYEGQAAIELENCMTTAGNCEAPAYRFALERGRLTEINPAPMWPQLFDDLAGGMAIGEIGARFHRGLAAALVDTAIGISRRSGTSRGASTRSRSRSTPTSRSSRSIT